MIFNGRNRVRYNYSRFGYTRGNGKTWHGGLDIEGIDDSTIKMPYYNGKSISGTVVRSRIVTDKNNATWEWGYYVCVQLDANQTPDVVNYLYFCHNSENLVQVGQKVKSGDSLAIMGNTGNAALANPPFAHCHFEVRQTSTGKGLDPTAYAGIPNKVGTYGSQNEDTNKTEIKGIDVSKYQGNIDWKKVKDSGIEFAMIRLLSSNNNGPYIDPYFEQNYNNAKSVGIKVGAYIYTYATTEEKQNTEITMAIEALKNKTLDYPLALDVEDRFLISIGKDALSNLVLRGLVIIDQKGYIPMLYTYTNYTSNLNMDIFKDYDLWIADYRGYNGYGECDIWQYSSSGSVNGISGSVDMNISYKNYGDEKEDMNEQKQIVTIGPVSNSDAMEFWNMSTELGLNYSAQQILTIGPMTNLEAMKFWNKAKEKQVKYSSEYYNGSDN